VENPGFEGLEADTNLISPKRTGGKGPRRSQGAKKKEAVIKRLVTKKTVVPERAGKAGGKEGITDGVEK